jgi:hypothetical protein
VYVDRNRDGGIPVATNTRKFCAIRLTEVLFSMKHWFSNELADFSAKLLMSQTVNTNLLVIKDCIVKFYNGPLPCCKSVTTGEGERETQTVLKEFGELLDHELKTQRAILFPASYLDICLAEPELLDYKAIKIDALRQHGTTTVDLYQEIVSGSWRGYRVLPGFEHVDFEACDSDGTQDDTTVFVERVMEVAEHLPKRARIEEHDHDWDLEELHDYLQEDSGEEDLRPYQPMPEEEDPPPPENPFDDGNQMARENCWACREGVANQMAHYGGCIEDPSA